MLPIFSEACWQGANCDPQEAVLAGECLTGVPRKVLEAWGDFSPSEKDVRPGKMLVWCDLLYPTVLFDESDDMEKLIARSKKAIEIMAPYRDAMLECRYASLIFEICVKKGEMVKSLRERYLSGDKAYLANLAENGLPELIALYDALMRTHRELWERDNRRIGWEMLALRYGATIGRLADVQDEIVRYVEGKLPAIAELDLQPRGLKKGGNSNCYAALATPAKNIW
jgi:hypothetical protein